MENIRFKCANCGSSNIQVRAWVNMNTNEYVGECDDGEFWCGNCEVLVNYEEVYSDKNYTVHIERAFELKTVKIEAFNKEEAIKKAEEMIANGEIRFTSFVDFCIIEED
jgi:uncharacterized Zn finger protein